MLYSFFTPLHYSCFKEVGNSQHTESKYVLPLDKNNACNYLQGHRDSQVFLFLQLDLLVPRKRVKMNLLNGF